MATNVGQVVKGDGQEAAVDPRPDVARTLDAHRGEHHIIVLQNYPDPDAISAAYAHKLISAEFEISTDIVYSGRISHPQNVALVKLLGIDLIPYGEGFDLSRYQGAVFVDSQGTTSEEIARALEAAHIPVVIIVDHHEAQARLHPEFSDVRRTGATATIYAEYLEQGLVQMDRNHKEHIVVATALLHGIMTDTGSLIRADTADFHAATFLSKFRDADLLAQIMSQARSRQTMETIRRALGNRVIAESFSIAGVSYLRAEDRDAIPQAADFLLTEENVHTAIVYGVVIGDDQTEAIVGSMRTRKLTLDPDEFIKDVFGKDVAGRYFGGGKLSAGGFQIHIEFLAGDHSEEYRERKWQVYDTQIRHKILTKIGAKPKSVESSTPA